MFEIKTLEDIRGNNVAIYSIKTLLERKHFPKLSIMSGVMGVGKTSVAKVVAGMLDESGLPVKIFNFGMSVDMQEISETVFQMNPSKPRVFIFEEIHGLPRNEQHALLQMFDTQSPNVYIICTTTEIHKVLRTIRSRAQVWEFKLLSDKQLSQLLDDYLELKGVVLSDQSRQSLLKAAHGIPRDLINHADFAIDGQFTAEQLDTLLGNVSDNSMYALFCALKSSAVDFATAVEVLMEDVSDTKLTALNDFWLRYMLERTGNVRKTLSKEMIETLDGLFTMKELYSISKLLLRATPDTLLLELVTLNMAFNSSSNSMVVGSQKDTALRNEKECRLDAQRANQTSQSARLSEDVLKGFKLEGGLE